MRVIVVSCCDVIREGLMAFLSRQRRMEPVLASRTVHEAMPVIRDNPPDIIIISVEKEDELAFLAEVKNTAVGIRFIVIDFNGDSILFKKALKLGVQGYLYGKSDEKELAYAIGRIIDGNKYYDPFFVDYLINGNSVQKESLEQVTQREKQILKEMAEGLSNREICEKLLITEHTVKKHVSNIFSKLNISSRAEAVAFLSRNKI